MTTCALGALKAVGDFERIALHNALVYSVFCFQLTTTETTSCIEFDGIGLLYSGFVTQKKNLLHIQPIPLLSFYHSNAC
jgi:hypothetical protein